MTRFAVSPSKIRSTDQEPRRSSSQRTRGGAIAVQHVFQLTPPGGLVYPTQELTIATCATNSCWCLSPPRALPNRPNGGGAALSEFMRQPDSWHRLSRLPRHEPDDRRRSRWDLVDRVPEREAGLTTAGKTTRQLLSEVRPLCNTSGPAQERRAAPVAVASEESATWWSPQKASQTPLLTPGSKSHRLRAQARSTAPWGPRPRTRELSATAHAYVCRQGQGTIADRARAVLELQLASPTARLITAPSADSPRFDESIAGLSIRDAQECDPRYLLYQRPFMTCDDAVECGPPTRSHQGVTLAGLRFTPYSRRGGATLATGPSSPWQRDREGQVRGTDRSLRVPYLKRSTIGRRFQQRTGDVFVRRIRRLHEPRDPVAARGRIGPLASTMSSQPSAPSIC